MEDKTKCIESVPKSLAGYQLVCSDIVREYDLVIPSHATSPDEWWLTQPRDEAVGVKTDQFGTIFGYLYRIYRKMPCPGHCDDKEIEAGAGTVMNEGHNMVQAKAKTDDDGKPPLAYIPWKALEEVAQVQAYGHSKYKDYNNYRKGMEIGRNLSCAMRHIGKYMEGQDLDDESKRSHLAHAACRIMFVLQNLADGVAIDDRYRDPRKH